MWVMNSPRPAAASLRSAALLFVLVALATVLAPSALALSEAPGVGNNLGTTAGADAAPSSPAAGSVQVSVFSDNGALDVDREFLEQETAKLDLPPEVTRVHYVLLSTNDDKFNDTMEQHIRATEPSMIADNDDRWANGVLISAVGLDPRRNGLYCGDDVCAALGLDKGSHLDHALDAGKDSFKNDRFGPGLLQQVSAALEEPEDGNGGMWGGIIGGTAVVGGLGAMATAFVAMRKSSAKKRREQFDYVSKNYGRIGQKLQEIDVRAHSLTSPIANDELRRQWAEVRDTFLSLHDTQSRIPDLLGADDKTLRKYGKDISSMYEATTHLEQAENNIDKLWDMEHGDTATRRRELENLREDLRAARLETAQHDAEVNELLHRCEQLALRLEADNFMDDYARLLRDSAVTSGYIAKEKGFKGLDNEAPKLHESGWRPGVGYYSYTPFVIMSTWNDEAQAASSTSTNTSYSSGFSGGGGSSSW